MKYKIFRLTREGFLKDIGYMEYNNYLEAENVVKGLKRSYKRKHIILKLY